MNLFKIFMFIIVAILAYFFFLKLSNQSWTLLLYKLDDASGIPEHRIRNYTLRECQEKGVQFILTNEKYRYVCGYGCPDDVNSGMQCEKSFYSPYYGCIDCNKVTNNH